MNRAIGEKMQWGQFLDYGGEISGNSKNEFLQREIFKYIITVL